MSRYPGRFRSARALAIGFSTLVIAGLLASSLPGAHLVGTDLRSSAARSQAEISAEGRPGVNGTSLTDHPPFLQRLSLADDPADGYVLAFGGENPAGAATGWTLVYRAGAWTNLTPDLSVAPPPRFGASMVYDPADGEVILFGGCQTSSCDPGLSDTWAFYDDQWHDITSTAGTPPAPRGYAAMAWDASDDYAVLFGGDAGTTTTTHYFSDTWAFSAGRWSNLTANVTGPGPSARSGASLAALSTGPAILFGGHGADGALGDTWSFHAGQWTNLSGSVGTAPSPRANSMFAADPPAGDLFLLGGVDGATYLDGAWTFQSGSWSPASAPARVGVFGAGFAYDSEDGYLLLYGGAIDQNGNAGTTNAYWSYASGEWHLFNPAPPSSIDWTALLPLLVVLIVIPVELVVLRRRQRRENASLSALMPPGPETVRWIASDPGSALGWNSRRSALVLYGVLVPMGVVLSLTILLGGTGSVATSLLLLLLIWVFLLGVPTLLLTARRRAETRALGVSDVGVIVRRPDGDLRIPWDYLQPPAASPRGPWLYFHYSLPGRQAGARGFGATHDQARAILAHPRARSWAIPPPVRDTLGLSATLPGSAGLPPTGRPLSENAPVGGLDLPPLPSGGPTGAPMQTPAPASVAASPLPTPGTPPARAPQLRRCARCGALSTVQARFCSRCGQPLG